MVNTISLAPKLSKRPYTIIVDFDGTIVHNNYPYIKEEGSELAIETLKLIANNHKLILYTMRSGKELEDAIEFCKSKGLEFDSINENPSQKRWAPDSKKVYADLIIDDNCLGIPICLINDKKYVDWIKVRELLELD